MSPGGDSRQPQELSRERNAFDVHRMSRNRRHQVGRCLRETPAGQGATNAKPRDDLAGLGKWLATCATIYGVCSGSSARD